MSDFFLHQHRTVALTNVCTPDIEDVCGAGGRDGTESQWGGDHEHRLCVDGVIRPLSMNGAASENQHLCHGRLGRVGRGCVRV